MYDLTSFDGQWKLFIKEFDRQLSIHKDGDVSVVMFYKPLNSRVVLDKFIEKESKYSYFIDKNKHINALVIGIDVGSGDFTFNHNHSQHWIEEYIEKFFTDKGTFLEIGAWNGEMISQTVRLEQDKGWTGLCVEPFPVNFGNRKCQLCSKAISKDGKPREFIKVTNDRRGGDVSYFSGFKDSIKANWDLIEQHCDYEAIEIGTITIQQLWDQYGLPDYIDFLSVDTEGSELEIFQTIDFDKLSFGLIVFEHNENAYTKGAIGKILTDAGYVLHEALRVDDIYVNRKLI